MEISKMDGKPLWESNFLKWFGNSKVVNEQGLPLVVYHGTGNSFSEFMSARDGLIFMSTEPDFAWEYGEDRTNYIDYDDGEVAAGVSLMPVYASAQNVWDYQNPQHVSELIRRLEAQGIEVDSFYREGIEDGDWLAIEEGRGALEAIKAMGHDAIWMSESSDMTRNLAVFRPVQIKSAIGNCGEFDSLNPDITK